MQNSKNRHKRKKIQVSSLHLKSTACHQMSQGRLCRSEKVVQKDKMFHWNRKLYLFFSQKI